MARNAARSVPASGVDGDDVVMRLKTPRSLSIYAFAMGRVWRAPPFLPMAPAYGFMTDFATGLACRRHPATTDGADFMSAKLPFTPAFG
jgi:hypothetical protein